MVNAPVCCDTSLLFSYFVTDVHTPNALGELKRLRQPLTITALNEFELINALYLAEYRRMLEPGKAAVYIADFQMEIVDGKLILTASHLGAVLTEAKRLSSVHTITGGHRSFDILHVAAALNLGATEFLSFDANQRKLAKAAGLKIRP